MSDGSHELPESDSGDFSGDLEMLLQTTVDRAEAKATKTDLETPPLDAQSPEEPTDKVVETERGAKIKISASKQKIEKTREDTSRAAADILRRMMRRCHDQ